MNLSRIKCHSDMQVYLLKNNLLSIAYFCLFGLSFLVGCGSGSNRNAVISNVVARSYTRYTSGINRAVPNAHVLVTWTPYTSTSATILEYQIFRDDQIIGVVSDSGPLSFSDDFSIRAEFTGIYPVTFRMPDTRGNGLDQFTVETKPLTVGQPHRYQVFVLYSVSAGGNQVFRRVPLNPTPMIATPLFPAPIPIISAMNASQVFATFSPLEFSGVDEYVYEFSQTQDFKVKVIRGPYKLKIPPDPLINVRQDTIDLSKEVVPTGSSTTIYYRVGIRKSTDSFPPFDYFGEIPNAGNYIYGSNPSEFSILTP